jgi:4-hydroxybenzoate polyprenyltransferase
MRFPMGDVLRLLRVSRPYYYLVTLWLYLMPTGQYAELFSRVPFWLGFSYCTVPLNALCYLMNDLSDVKVDKQNMRKGGALLGAKESEANLRTLVPTAAMLQLPFLLSFAALCGLRLILPWFSAVVAVNWAYNFGPRLSAYYAPLDLICPCGYILVIPLSCWLNALPYPPGRSWVHAVVLVVRTQLWIQTFDIEPDRAAGRRNTAVRLGLRGSQFGLLALLLAENAFVHTHFAHSWPLRSFSLGSLGLLGAQALLGGGRASAVPSIHSTPPPPSSLSPASVQAVFLILGLGGVGLMVRVWLDAAFL